MLTRGALASAPSQLGSSTHDASFTFSGPVSDQNGADGGGIKTSAPNPSRDQKMGMRDFFMEESTTKVMEFPTSDPHTNWSDDAKQQSHPLPHPPEAIPKSPQIFCLNSAVTSPSAPLPSPERAQSHKSPWKRGELLSKGAVGNIYLGFNSENGKMCAVKEFILYYDGSKLEQSARCLRKHSFWDYKRSQSQFESEIALLSSLKHPNIVPYYGSEVVGDNLYCFYEYISRGSLYMILQKYGKLGESDIRSYTQQFLSGLAYLHSKSIPHRDIRGANILVDPNGVVKLSNFGLEKQIAAQIRPLVLIDSPYWMAPEVTCNPNSHNNAIDIWSLGCTVIEMATSKPPFSQYEWIVALFKIAHHRELPTIPDHLSDVGKDFLRRCLQWDPMRRATTSQLLEHPFVKGSPPVAKQIGVSTLPDHPPVTIASKPEGILDPASHPSEASKYNFKTSDACTTRNISTPVSPVSSPLLNPYMLQPETFRYSPKHSPTIMNAPAYWDPNIASPSDNDSHCREQLIRDGANGRVNEQLALADHIFRQLVGAPVMSNQSADRNTIKYPFRKNRLVGV